LEGWIRVIGSAAILLLAALGMRFYRREKSPAARSLSGMFLFAFAAPLVVMRLLEAVSGRALTQPRYLVFVTPYLFLLSAQWLGSSPRLVMRAARIALAALALGGMAGYLVAGALIDPRLEAYSARLREADPRMPIIHLQEFYYVPLRYY